MKKVLFAFLAVTLFLTASAMAGHIRSDGHGGYYDESGKHIRSDGHGGYYDPQKGHIKSDGKGGFYHRDKHIRSDGKGGFYR